MSHWIIAPVVLPAVLAALIVLLARGNLAAQRGIALVGAVVLLAIAALLLLASTAGPEVYRLGNWPAPFGIVLVLDRLSALMLALVAGLSVPVLIYVIGTGWDARGRHFHALFLFQLMGLNGAFLTGDAFNLFVFFEVLLIASYGLMIHGGGRDRLRAGVQYVAFNLLGSTLFLIALATIYAVTGTLNMADLAGKVAALPEGEAGLIRAAAVMLMLVFAVKGALVPLQFWLPGTYANAPGPVAALFAVMTKVGAYAVIRMGTLVFPGLWPLIGGMLEPAAVATIVLGALGVLGSRNLARLVAFAAIGSMGLLFLAVSAFSVQATAAALYYLIHSTLAAAVLFLLADLVLERRGGLALQAGAPMSQLGLIAGLFMAGAVAMAGMPPLSGFVGKLLVMQAMPAAWVWTVILLASFVTMLGLARAGSVLFWKAHETGEMAPHPAQPLAFGAVGLLVAGLIGLTVFAGPVTAWLTLTAEALHAPAAYIAANGLESP
ncbi:MAG: monovalent cation/H+ antiporter subunit D [Rhodobacterales bacterium RIFCSPHIGHO2_02_FULL_62_130]|jgi:multicomponent K+:H+ antiporter subunit D|nr:MAG: monovalent cation/H+ antiporter subunit D [Rhodobacterales bacterium RIFCSPHIGHO2_02_FULL_62_130]OHC60937.1 MAG: monovalent cation/H+ antiporter subunit D [Rhodobacterales bacterium RIFCSPHIGHO2_12_FULL_62_75]HCY99231.1 monovalent cation/H+ antiporter subunit D [Rhodobacter sp.]